MSWPLAARAQQLDRVRRIGILTPLSQSDREAQREYEVFKQVLQNLGWQDGRTVQFSLCLGAIDPERRQACARELVAIPADVIVAYASPQVAALLKETRYIPIVFANVSDPVGSGFATSLAHPGANVTGFTNFEIHTGAKVA